MTYPQAVPDPATAHSTGRNGGGNGTTDKRLRDVEVALASLDTRITTKFEHIATREWVLAGVIAGMMIAATLSASIAIAIVRLWPD